MTTEQIEFKSGDRVRRKETNGPDGTVKQIRVESIKQTMKSDDVEQPGVTVTVLWDNGTTSHFIPDGLEAC